MSKKVLKLDEYINSDVINQLRQLFLQDHLPAWELWSSNGLSWADIKNICFNDTSANSDSIQIGLFRTWADEINKK